MSEILNFLDKYPAIKLKSGNVILNYSSPHSYKFHTGEILPACSDDVARETKLEANHGKIHNKKGWIDVSISYCLSKMQRKELPKLVAFDEIDIILVPYPVLNALKSELNWQTYWAELVFEKIRVCKLHDRVTKVIRSDEFCI